MNFTDLEVFKAVVDEGGINKAARRLRRAPSNVSDRIKNLEQILRVPLFHRDRRRLHLSASGELLLEYAERLLTLSQEAQGVVSGTGPRGAFKLGAIESTVATRLPSLLFEYRRRYPGVNIELLTGTTDFLVDAVVKRRLDAAIVAKTPNAMPLSSFPFFKERLTLIAGLHHAPIKSPRDARGLSPVASPEGSATRRIFQRWLGGSAAASCRILEYNSYQAIVACVASGAGFALVPDTVLSALNSAQVSRNSISKAYAEIVTTFVWRKDELSTAAAAFRDQMFRL
jgi:DNA-binding transcriptional LysR family regulator